MVFYLRGAAEVEEPLLSCRHSCFRHLPILSPLTLSLRIWCQTSLRILLPLLLLSLEDLLHLLVEALSLLAPVGEGFAMCVTIAVRWR